MAISVSTNSSTLGLEDLHRDIWQECLAPYMSVSDYFMLSFTCKRFYDSYELFFGNRFPQFPNWEDIEYSVGLAGDEKQLEWLRRKLKFPISEMLRKGAIKGISARLEAFNRS